jgi:hypothetical protein
MSLEFLRISNRIDAASIQNTIQLNLVHDEQMVMSENLHVEIDILKILVARAADSTQVNIILNLHSDLIQML